MLFIKANQPPLQCSLSKTINQNSSNETKVICDIGNPIVSNTGVRKWFNKI